ncbi:hypothetical protein [Streptomyces sp. NPDC054834]
MLRAFVEVDRATIGPERLSVKLTSYARLHDYVPAPVPGRPRPAAGQQPPEEDWRRRYPLFPRLLFVLDGTEPTGVETRIRALRATASQPALSGFLRSVPVLAASLVGLLPRRPLRTRVAARPRSRTHSQLEPGRHP